MTSSTPLLSQALTKDPLPTSNDASSGTAASAESKGVIDLTDEDDKTTTTNTLTTNTILGMSPVVKTQTTTTVRTATSISANIAIMATKASTTTGVATTTASRVMYLLQPNPQTVTSDPTKPATTKALMFKFPNGVIGE